MLEARYSHYEMAVIVCATHWLLEGQILAAIIATVMGVLGYLVLERIGDDPDRFWDELEDD